MGKLSLKHVVGAALIFVLSACVTTNEVTGRSQFITIPASEDTSLGLEAMAEVKKTAPVLESGPMVDRVRRIGKRIAAISDNPNLPWDFVVIDEPVLNAWALPGGKVAVYAKMVNSLTDDAELAAVLGHEIAHAVLRHGAEQLSRAQMQSLIIVGVGAAVGAATKDDEKAQLAVGLGSLAAQGFVALPHSRSMELEADDIGTRYMAKAGYDPRAAVRLWEHMKTLKDAGGPPTFLSTHPSDDKRIDRLQAQMPYYLSVYKKR
ncbi:M48 family metallopeptidase [Kordiimonas marina]|uniref:M48 family metallopeptidase n=1 Tax=Kordiimonas marina TaxID=2872312 RepID=UPI001FF5A841|nr:M48 family metallopeptidase [Kordiimonas marina]MCJ9429455.1 M48 family metallopeptidase [Kordiimonas marina]